MYYPKFNWVIQNPNLSFDQMMAVISSFDQKERDLLQNYLKFREDSYTTDGKGDKDKLYELLNRVCGKYFTESELKEILEKENIYFNENEVDQSFCKFKDVNDF